MSLRAFAALLFAVAFPVLAQAPTDAPKPAAPPTARLFAIEITTGPNWDATRQPSQQAHFRDHSAHLKKLRDEGRIKMGARYADKGFIVLEAADEAEARTLVEADPAMKGGTFKFSLAEMRVFYPGQVGAERKPAP